MKSLIVLLMVAGSLLAGCVVEEPGYRNRDGARYDGARSSGDRDRDGVPNRADRDRDGDGVRNNQDRRPDDPRRY